MMLIQGVTVQRNVFSKVKRRRGVEWKYGHLVSKGDGDTFGVVVVYRDWIELSA